ncbi:hypothetical protein Tco_0846319 [Tanacetum coccineum]
MFSLSTGLFSFQFSPNNPLILKKWHPDVNLLKEDVGTIPVWVKLHGVSIMEFSDAGLSAISTKLGTPLMVDSYTSDMYMQLWGRGCTNGRTSNLASQATNYSGSSFRNVDASSPSTTLVIKKIDKIEKLIIEGKVTLVDDDGKPLEKVDSSYDYDSEDEVAFVDNDMAKFLVKKDGYGTQSLLEQWTESYKNGDYGYDPYDDDMYEGQDINKPLQAICDKLDITVRGRRKK